MPDDFRLQILERFRNWCVAFPSCHPEGSEYFALSETLRTPCTHVVK